MQTANEDMKRFSASQDMRKMCTKINEVAPDTCKDDHNQTVSAGEDGERNLHTLLMKM